MGKVGKASSKGVDVYVRNLYFCHMAIIAKYKIGAMPEELARFTEFMQVLKQIPEEHGRIIFLKYLKHSHIEPKQWVLGSRVALVSERYKCKGATHVFLAELLDVKPIDISKLENAAYQSFAEALLKHRIDTGYYKLSTLTRSKLIQAEDREGAEQKLAEFIKETACAILDRVDKVYNGYYGYVIDVKYRAECYTVAK